MNKITEKKEFIKKRFGKRNYDNKAFRENLAMMKHQAKIAWWFTLVRIIIFIIIISGILYMIKTY